jgi:hypothetical protein
MGTRKTVSRMSPNVSPNVSSWNEVMFYMAKITKVSKTESKNLAAALSRAKKQKVVEYSSPAVLARVLLEAFLFEDSDINADWFVREKACTKGGFTKLRDRLVKDRWLHFRDDTKRYFPGSRLKPHLDAVKKVKAVTFADLERKADKEELALLDARKVDRVEFAEVADDVQDLKAQMNEIREILAELKRLQAPPPSAQAQQRSAELTEKLEELMVKAKLQ